MSRVRGHSIQTKHSCVFEAIEYNRDVLGKENKERRSVWKQIRRKRGGKVWTKRKTPAFFFPTLRYVHLLFSKWWNNLFNSVCMYSYFYLHGNTKKQTADFSFIWTHLCSHIVMCLSQGSSTARSLENSASWGRFLSWRMEASCWLKGTALICSVLGSTSSHWHMIRIIFEKPTRKSLLSSFKACYNNQFFFSNKTILFYIPLSWS